MQVFTSVLVLAIALAVFILTDVNAYKQRRTQSIRNLAQVISNNSISTLQFQDEKEATEMLAELHKVAPEIIHAEIKNINGDIFATYSNDSSGTFKIPGILATEPYAYANHHLFVTNPIRTNNETIGNVYLDVQLTDLQEIKQYKFELAAILLIIAVAFSFLIALFVQSYISKRLLRLVNTMKTVSKTGEYDNQISEEGKDEIATLIRVFNNLMQQIKLNLQKKDEFIGIASHELKTPLTTIKGYIEMLNMLEQEPLKKQFVEKAMSNVSKLERLIKDLLDVSKIQSGQLQLEMQEFNINNLLTETINAVQLVHHHKIIRHDHLKDEMIFGDRQRIEQVLINLLSNAIKYSPGEERIIVDAEKTAKNMLIKIRDFGVGVTEEEKLNIFKRFYRSKNTSVHISGFGLGLYICRDIIKRHHGDIWVERTGKGSIFIFSLPLKNTLSTKQIAV